MSNQYSQFSELIEMPKDAIDELERRLLIKDNYDETVAETLGINIYREAENIIAIWAEEMADIRMLSEIIQEVMEIMDLCGNVIIEYAETDSNFRPGSFGGGIYIINSSEITEITTLSFKRKYKSPVKVNVSWNKIREEIRAALLSVDGEDYVSKRQRILDKYGVTLEEWKRTGFTN